MNMRSISLLSSGLDSIAALAIAKEQGDIVLALTFDYGQRSAKYEIEYSAIICERYGIEHRVIGLDWLGSITNTSLVRSEMDIPQLSMDDISSTSPITEESAKNVWVPNRNGVMLNIAASFAESLDCGHVIAGFNGEESRTFPDNSEEFVYATDKCLSYSTRNDVRILAPLIELNKTDIVRQALDANAPLQWSWSCYQGGEGPCGVCESCVRRARAFMEVGVEDPLIRRLNDAK